MQQKSYDFAKFTEETETVSVSVSVASHISETSEAIAITFDTVTVSVIDNASRVVVLDLE